MTESQPFTSSPAEAEELFCSGCGYNLRGIASSRCPECGQPIDWAALRLPRIPWAHRRAIGRIRAYWRTVWWVTIRPAEIGKEAARPVSYRDGQVFRWVTVAWVFVTLAMAALLGNLTLRRFRVDEELLSTFFIPAGAFCMTLLSFLIWLVIVTGIGSYFHHSKWLPIVRQNRAIALSYYACACLAWLPIVLLLVIGAAWLQHRYGSETLGRHAIRFMGSELVDWIVVLAWILPYLQLLEWWWSSIQILRFSTGSGFGRCLALAVFLPVSWLALLIASFWGLHLIGSYLVLIFRSWLV